MNQLRKPLLSVPFFVLGSALLPVINTSPIPAQETFDRLQDRGEGVVSSQFGTYIGHRQFFVYTYFEYYHDADYEYKPAELGYGLDTDYRGKYTASEGLIFLGYGLTQDLIMEFEAAVISAKLQSAPEDTSGAPASFEESGLGDVEAQIRWRFLNETEDRPEFFTYFESVFPLQKDRYLIGTSDWELKLGVGAVRGYRWGTMTVRLSAEYTRAEEKVDAGQYAVEYLKRLSDRWRIVALIEGNQLDEVELITEAQWTIVPRLLLKLNVGWGLTTNAVDFAPEVGLMFWF